MNTLLLDLTNWDLVLDINGNIAVASDPYSQAQDGASACRTFLGEVYYDTTIGVSYGNILGQLPPLPYLKQQYVNAALTVPGVVNAKAFVTGFAGRALTGQVQMTNTAGQTAAATF